MKKLQLFLLGFSFLFANFAYTQAPVEDASENVANYSSEPDDLQPLAHDDGNSYFDGAPQGKNTASPRQQEISQLLNQIQELKQTVQELRGQLDAQNQTIQTLKDQQLTLYKDLDARISALGSKPAATVKPKEQLAQNTSPETTNEPAISHSTPQNPADEQISYMAAYNFVEKKQYTKATLALQEFIQQYPKSPYAANAEYWLGELFLQQKDYARAIAHFENVVNNFPESNKSAASLYKLGVTHVANGDKAQAKAKFQEVLQKYPDSDAAQLATNQLKIL
jgi:tol-pal system protein YbgF